MPTSAPGSVTPRASRMKSTTYGARAVTHTACGHTDSSKTDRRAGRPPAASIRGLQDERGAEQQGAVMTTPAAAATAAAANHRITDRIGGETNPEAKSESYF